MRRRWSRIIKEIAAVVKKAVGGLVTHPIVNRKAAGINPAARYSVISRVDELGFYDVGSGDLIMPALFVGVEQDPEKADEDNRGRYKLLTGKAIRPFLFYQFRL
jgi:hypothetical protein